MLAITVTILAAEVAGALLSGSLALLADAGHMLMDAGGIALALLAFRFGQRSPSQARTFGYLRLEILAAAFNALLLFAIGVFVIVVAVRRLIHPPEVASGIMLLTISTLSIPPSRSNHPATVITSRSCTNDRRTRTRT